MRFLLLPFVYIVLLVTCAQIFLVTERENNTYSVLEAFDGIRKENLSFLILFPLYFGINK